jgi:hypothetical protein
VQASAIVWAVVNTSAQASAAAMVDRLILMVMFVGSPVKSRAA